MDKKEKWLLKRQQKQDDQLKRDQKKKAQKILMFALPGIILLGGIFFLVKTIASGGSSNPPQSGTPRIEINPKTYDFGTVSMEAGKIKTVFEIKNTGDGDLELEDMRTSCHCTTVVLETDGKKTREFGMEGSGFWSGTISPGQTGQLEVIFDPAFHGLAGVGQATREVYFSTNDPQNKSTRITMEANVVP